MRAMKPLCSGINVSINAGSNARTSPDLPDQQKQLTGRSHIAHIMASMDVIDVLQQQFFTAAQNDLMTRMASGEIDTDAKKDKLI